MKSKKSLLISTIAMVVLLVVALSTATFAWYSSQNQVTATGATLSTAATTDANIAIYWGDTGSGSTVELGAKAGIKPMIPTTDPTLSTDGNVAFNEGILTTNESGAYVFKTVGPATPWTQVDANNASNTVLKIENKDTDTSRKVTIVPSITTISGEIVSGNTTPEAQQEALVNDVIGFLRIAIFASNEAGTTFSCLGVYSSGDAFFGVPQVGSAPNSVTTKITTVGQTSFTGFDVKGTKTSTIKIYAWLEGGSLTAAHQLVSVSFDITFAAGNPTPVGP